MKLLLLSLSINQHLIPIITFICHYEAWSIQDAHKVPNFPFLFLFPKFPVMSFKIINTNPAEIYIFLGISQSNFLIRKYLQAHTNKRVLCWLMVYLSQIILSHWFLNLHIIFKQDRKRIGNKPIQRYLWYTGRCLIFSLLLKDGTHILGNWYNGFSKSLLKRENSHFKMCIYGSHNFFCSPFHSKLMS